MMKIRMKTKLFIGYPVEIFINYYFFIIIKVKMLIASQKCAGEMRQCASSDAFWRKTIRILVRCRWRKCRKLLSEIRDVGTGGHRGIVIYKGCHCKASLGALPLASPQT